MGEVSGYATTIFKLRYLEISGEIETSKLKSYILKMFISCSAFIVVRTKAKIT